MNHRPTLLAAGVLLLAELSVTAPPRATFAAQLPASPAAAAAPLTMVGTAMPAASVTTPDLLAVGGEADLFADLSARFTSAITATPTLTITAKATPAGAAKATAAVPVTAGVALTPVQPSTAVTGTPAVAASAPLTAQLGALEGTIVVNLSSVPIQFFVEGRVYALPPQQSTGLDLPRPTGVLMLYSCDAEAPAPGNACFWDAYLLEQGGLYEVRAAAEIDPAAGFLLTASGPPPDGKVWVQNRTGRVESVVYRDKVYDLAASAVQEFSVEPDTPAVLYVRSCLHENGESVCEWSPKSLNASVYYAMQEVSTAGAEPGATVTTIELRPVITGGQAEAIAETRVTCTLEVPAVNIRNGPGLQYDIIGKVRSTAQGPGTLVVTGRSADQLWYTVADEVVANGWVTSSSSFIACSGDLAGLPTVEFTGSRVAASTPVPTPVSAASRAPTPAPVGGEPEATPAATEATVEPPPVAEDTPTPAAEPGGPAVPPGQGLLVVNNGFMYDIRFTVDQMYRPQEGPSEYDLAPGESVAVVVFPGHVAFTASSPWNGLSGNADISVAPDQAVTLWLRFEAEPNESGQWNLVWQ